MCTDLQPLHYNDVIMSMIASKNSLTIASRTVYLRRRSKKNITAPRPWPLWGESTGDRRIPAQRASNAKSVSIWWRHHAYGEFYIRYFTNAATTRFIYIELMDEFWKKMLFKGVAPVTETKKIIADQDELSTLNNTEACGTVYRLAYEYFIRKGPCAPSLHLYMSIIVQLIVLPHSDFDCHCHQRIENIAQFF